MAYLENCLFRASILLSFGVMGVLSSSHVKACSNLTQLLAQISPEQKRLVLAFYRDELYMKRLSTFSYLIREYTPHLSQANHYRTEVGDILDSDGRINRQKYPYESNTYVISWHEDTKQTAVYFGQNMSDRTPHAILGHCFSLVCAGSFWLSKEGKVQSLVPRSSTYMQQRDRQIETFISSLPGIQGRANDIIIGMSISTIKSLIEELDRQVSLHILTERGLELVNPAALYSPLRELLGI